MKLKNIRLTLANVARTTNAKTMPVNGTGVVKERNEDGTLSDRITQYTIDCSGYRGDTLKVKFDTNVADKIEELNKLLENDMNVEISFVGLKLTPYALKATDGSVLSGVSAKATDFVIEKSDLDEFVDLGIE